MRTYYEGPTYTVAFDENDTACFAHNTDADASVVHGSGAFVFDTATGELLEGRGAAKGHTEMEWLAFSQDAQDFAQLELSHHGIAVRAFDFGCDLPEISNPAKARKAKGGTPAVKRTVILTKAGKGTRHNPGAKAFIANVDDDGDVWVLWEDGDWSALAEDDEWHMPPSYNPDDLRITRTRGVKGYGPYSEKHGYKTWINKRDKLGEGFLTTMSKQERHDALDRCVREHSYRSCLGSIMVLERAHRGPHGKGEGVGVRYAQQLAESRKYLREKYGGPGSFAPIRGGARYAADRARVTKPRTARANPEASVHRERMEDYFMQAGSSLRGARSAYDHRDPNAALRYLENAKRHTMLAEHEAEDAELDESDRAEVDAAIAEINDAINAITSAIQGKPSTAAASNPKSARARGARTANPEASVHRERMESYIHEAATSLRDAKAKAASGNMEAALGRMADAKRYVLLAKHEAEDAGLDPGEHEEIVETIDLINEANNTLFTDEEIELWRQRLIAGPASSSSTNPKPGASNKKKAAHKAKHGARR